MDGTILPRRADALRDLARRFAEGAAAHDREASFPHENIAALREANLFGLTVPVEFGGDDIGLPRAAEVVGTVAEGCPATALVLAMQLIQQRGIARNPAVSPVIRARLGRGAAERGEVIKHPDGHEFEVIDADPRRIKRLRIRLADADRAAEPDKA